MRPDFCALILTHGRPDKVLTVKSIRRAGYTGPVFLLVDDEDETADRYIELYGEQVVKFSKSEIAKRFDEGDNFGHFRGVIYARNASFNIAKSLGYKYFIQLDDDYTEFYFMLDNNLRWLHKPIRKGMDGALEALVEFLEASGAKTVCMAQGGDFLGGAASIQHAATRRKAMNSFVCSVDRPFHFVGRINEDTNTYTSRARVGDLFFTVMALKLVQAPTQKTKGGMTELYLDNGTYIKSFYSVMYCPSCVKVGELGDHRSPSYRIHHAINWHRCAALILSERHRKL